jgi:hypothetical protein
MKNFILFLILGVFTACSSEDNGPEANPNLELARGTWQLQELQINPAQDINEDGQSTTNILEELTCLNGTLQLNMDYTWTFEGTDVIITTITGGLFKFFCSENLRTSTGIWDLNGNALRLADDLGNVTSFSLDANTLTLTNAIGNSLPGLQAEVYSKR